MQMIYHINNIFVFLLLFLQKFLHKPSIFFFDIYLLNYFFITSDIFLEGKYIMINIRIIFASYEFLRTIY